MFGKATIRLGIDPRSSFACFLSDVMHPSTLGSSSYQKQYLIYGVGLQRAVRFSDYGRPA